MEKVRAILIIEIAGRPAEVVSEALKQHSGKLKNVKGVKVFSEKFSEPKRLESEQEFYTAFSEIEIETESFAKLIELIFEFMPSSVEIFEPAEVLFNAQEATIFANNLASRLHRYDEIAKIAKIRVNQLAEKFQEMQKKAEENSGKTRKKGGAPKSKAVQKEKKKNQKKSVS